MQPSRLVARSAAPLHRLAQALFAVAVTTSPSAYAASARELAGSYCTSKLADRAQLKDALVAHGEAAARALVEVLRSDRHACWERSTDVLIAIGPAAAAVVPDLLAMLRAAREVERVAASGGRSASEYMRGMYAAGAASAISPSDPALVAQFVDMLERGTPSSKAMAARLLAGGKSADAAVRIARALDDGSAMVRTEAALALGEMGAAADPAVPALLAAAERDRADYLAQASMIALRKIGTPRARDALRRLDTGR